MEYTDIKSYEDALNVLKDHGVISSNYMNFVVKTKEYDNEYRDMSMISRSMDATFKLTMICKAINLLIDTESIYTYIPEIFISKENWKGIGFHVDIENHGKFEIRQNEFCPEINNSKFPTIGIQSISSVKTKEAAEYVAMQFGNLIFDTMYGDILKYNYI